MHRRGRRLGVSSGGFRDKLRRLRRDPVEPAIVANVEGSSEAGASGAPTVPRAATSVGEPSELITRNDGLTWCREASYPVDTIHGHFALDEVRSADPRDFELLTGDESLAKLDLERAVYLDTETTGLSGGAGTYVFMIGLGAFVVGASGATRFVVWQGFLRGPEGEAALLAECAQRVADGSSLVSFFGKSFDRHRLEDKMQLCGVAPPFADRPHLDLYHPCRRLYRGAYEDGRLKTMERELCGLDRLDDLPGAFAPEAWFDYLAERPHRLEGVFRHNLDDVLSLVTLAAHLGRSRLETRSDRAALSGNAAARAAGIARSLMTSSDRAEALPWLERALERGHGEHRELGCQRAELLSKLGEHDLAREAFDELLAAPEDRYSARAGIELAKLFEHKLKDPAAALQAARVAQLAAPRTLVGREYARAIADLERRIARLAKRVAETQAQPASDGSTSEVTPDRFGER